MIVETRVVVLAFRVEVKGWSDATCIVRTISRARAKFFAWNSAQGVGYDLPFGRFRVVRAKLHDKSESLKPDRCYTMDFASTLFE